MAATREFYTSLLGLDAAWESDWYVLLQGRDQTVQLAIVDRYHDSVPGAHRQAARGVLITFEVDDATKLWERARQLGVPIELPLTDEDFGQRYFMAIDPNGLLVDVVQTLFVPDAG